MAPKHTRIRTEKMYLMIRICIVELLYFTECLAFYLAWPSSGTPEGKGGGGGQIFVKGHF